MKGLMPLVAAASLAVAAAEAACAWAACPTASAAAFSLAMASSRLSIGPLHGSRNASGRLGLEIRMHDRAASGQAGRLDQFVVRVDRDRLGGLVDQGLDEGVQVARVERRGGGGEPRHAGVADDSHAVLGGDDFVDLGEFA